MKGVYMFLADGFEDIEAIATRDILSRGKVDVKLVSISGDPFAVSSHGLTIGVDLTLDECLSEEESEADAKDFMIFPGGMPGSKRLAGCSELIELMNRHYADGGSVAAICAAPGLVLSQLEGISGEHFTCFDSFESKLEAQGAVFERKPAVTSGRIITGRGSGHTLDFGFAILEAIKGKDAVTDVTKGMILECD